MPPSPFIFLLVAEALSHIIQKYREERKLKGVRLSNTIELTHVLFVDNVLLMGEGSYKNFEYLTKILKTY